MKIDEWLKMRKNTVSEIVVVIKLIITILNLDYLLAWK
jgi:hypothetical protein